jgi:hypothetical protein
MEKMDVLITLIIVPLVVAGVVAYALTHLAGSKHRRYVQGLDTLRELPDHEHAPPLSQPSAEDAVQSRNWRVIRPKSRHPETPGATGPAASTVGPPERRAARSDRRRPDADGRSSS